MALAPENRYNKNMGLFNVFKSIFVYSILLMTMTSCAAINQMISSDEDGSVEVKELSASQRLQISLPLPENTKIVSDKTIIFGEPW